MNLKLRELREARGLTPRQMYERLGVQDSRYRKWESQAAMIPLDYAIRCADVLHCTLDELVGRKPIQQPSTSTDERRLLDAWHGIDPTTRPTILSMVEAASGVEKQSPSRAVGA